MPVFGLVVTLAQPDAARERALERLARDARVVLGELAGARLPIVLETRGARDERAFIDGLLASGDVLQVDVAFAHFEDLELGGDREEMRRGHEA